MRCPSFFGLVLTLLLTGCTPPQGQNLPDLRDMHEKPVPPTSLAQKQRDMASLREDATEMWALAAKTPLTPAENDQATKSVRHLLGRETA